LHNFGYYPLVVRSSSRLSKGITLCSSLIRAHAPDQIPPADFGSRLISAGLCRLLPVPAGRWPFPTLGTASLSLDAWIRIPTAPKVLLLASSFGTSAFPTTVQVGRLTVKYPAKQIPSGGKFSGSSSFLTFRPPVLLATLTAPTVMVPPASSFAPADSRLVPSFGPGLFSVLPLTRKSSIRQRWLFPPSRTYVVTFICIGYASRSNRAINDRGLSPHKTCSHVGCSTVGFPESRVPRRRMRTRVYGMQDWVQVLHCHIR